LSLFTQPEFNGEFPQGEKKSPMIFLSSLQLLVKIRAFGKVNSFPVIRRPTL
jgi:hypothetical protein